MFPEISVIVPVYNTAAYIRDCLASLRDQTMRSFEIIIVNDGSTDSSEEVYREFFRENPDLTIKEIKQKNSGLSAARNAGLAVASGKYVFFLDSDDWLAPETFRTLFDFIDEKDLDVVGQLPLNCYSDGTTEPVNGYFVLNGKFNVLDDSGKDFTFKSLFFAGAPMKMYRRDFLCRSKMRFIVGIKFEDNPFWISVLRNSRRIGMVREHFYHYRCGRNGSIMSGKDFRDMPFSYYMIQNLVFRDERFAKFRGEFQEIIFMMALKRLFLSDEKYRGSFYRKVRLIFRRGLRLRRDTGTSRRWNIKLPVCWMGILIWRYMPYRIMMLATFPVGLMLWAQKTCRS